MLIMSCNHSEDGNPTATIEDLQKRCQALLSDLEQFRSHLKSIRRENSIEIRPFDNNIKADLKALQKLDPSHERIVHLLRSTNVPFFEAVWEAARRSQGVIAFVKRFYWEDKEKGVKRAVIKPEAEGSRSDIKAPTLKYRNSALVDIVADDGATWIKVSTITQNRLIWQLARQGWNPDDDESDEDEEQIMALDNEEVSILRMAQELYTASLEIRVRFKHPRVHLILPKLTQPLLPPIQGVINRLNRIYPTIAISLGGSPLLSTTAPSLTTALQQGLVVDPIASLTPTLNIDCTILLALVSDLSHARDGDIERQDWFHRATLRQLEMEKEDALLPRTLYPALEGCDLICTEEAAKRMGEIVATIATESERKRTELLLQNTSSENSNESMKSTNGSSILDEWAKLSDYPLPANLRLPIRIVSANSDSTYPSSTDTRVAQTVSEHLSPLNKSVFLHGWRTGLSTVTSNRTVVKEVDSLITSELDALEKGRKSTDSGAAPEFVGPNIWLCGMSRSLIGKEKGRH